METKSLLIEGMTCEACRQRVEKIIVQLPGVSKASVSLVSRIGMVDLDSPTTIDDVIVSIKSIGYNASLLDDSQNDRLEEDYLGYEKWGMISSLLLFAIIFVQMVSGLGIKLFNSFGFSQSISVILDASFQGLFCLIIFILGRSILLKGLVSIWHLKPNMYALIAIGSLTGIIYSFYKLIILFVGVESLGYGESIFFFDASASILSFMMLGKYLESHGKKIASKALFDLLKTKPLTATRVNDNGEHETVTIKQIKKGDIVIVKPGEQVPVDGVIVKGQTEIDESLLTGESMPVMKNEGNSVVGGSFNTNGSITIEVTAAGEQTVFSKMIELLSKIGEEKKGLAYLADKVAAYFIPVILICSLISLVFWLIQGAGIAISLEYFITILVIACPCALGLATPLAITISVFGTAKQGILVTDFKALESVNKIKYVFFDKTGTLTDRVPQVAHFIELVPENNNSIELLKEIVILESQSHHPLADALITYGLKKTNTQISIIQSQYQVTDMSVIPGKGIQGLVNGVNIKAGSQHLIDISSLKPAVKEKINHELIQGSSILYIERNQVLIGYFILHANIHPDAKNVINYFNKKGIRTVLLSGDSPVTVEKVSTELGISDFKGKMTPYDKVEFIKKYQDKKQAVMMVGDGLNDSLALKQSDLSICMSQGSGISLQSASIVMSQYNLGKLPRLLGYLGKTNKIIKQNLFWALFYNVLSIPLAMGLLKSLGIPTISPMIGALSMALSSLLVTLNSLRLKYQ